MLEDRRILKNVRVCMGIQFIKARNVIFKSQSALGFLLIIIKCPSHIFTCFTKMPYTVEVYIFFIRKINYTYYIKVLIVKEK